MASRTSRSFIVLPCKSDDTGSKASDEKVNGHGEFTRKTLDEEEEEEVLNVCGYAMRTATDVEVSAYRYSMSKVSGAEMNAYGYCMKNSQNTARLTTQIGPLPQLITRKA
jgi:hypothetical protein